jgi:hypothetical protein
MRLDDALRAECVKLITRFELYARELRDDDGRRSRRTGVMHRGNIHRPSYWQVNSAFDPYRVRASCAPIARAVGLALRAHDYSPLNPVAYQVPKPGGDKRTVSVFAVADAVVSRRVYSSLLAKNKARLSAYSYAYRDDLTAHDAIQHISADLTGRGRLFLAEYDFSKYFDTISHEYLWRTLEQRAFLMTDLERQVLEQFLQANLQEQANYQARSHQTERRTHGVPQGTSVSLFLANVAAWELDRALERLGIGFARYADDTLIWSHDYARICDAVETLSGISTEIGSPLNFKKSHGISIFTPEGAPAEFKSKSSVEFVGYRFSEHGVGMRESVVHRIKQRLAYLVWVNLLEPLKNNQFVSARTVPRVDRDYLVMVMQIRRYMYGDLNEDKLRRLRNGSARRVHYPGVMSYFPLVTDLAQLKALDGWLLHTVYTSLQARGRLLAARGVSPLPDPHGLSRSDLPAAYSSSNRTGRRLDLRLPSFVRIGTAIGRAAQAHGPNAVGKKGGPQHYKYPGI